MPRNIVVLVPAPLEARTGGYEYDRRMIAGLRRRGWQVDVHELGSGFPHPVPDVRAHAARTLATIPDRTMVLVDGLAFSALPAELALESSRLTLVAIVHMPLGAGADLEPDSAAALDASERLALSTATLVVVTGRSTVGAIERQGIARHRIVVIEPGTDRALRSRGSNGTQLELLAVGTVTEGKGHQVLVRALGTIPERNWHLTCAGSLTRDPRAAAELHKIVRHERLEEHVSIVGEIAGPDLSARYQSADVFVLATLHETYCMAVAEALAHGLPVVSTTTGAIPEMVGASGTLWCAGLLVPPGDVSALADALSRVLSDGALRASLAHNAWQKGATLPTWDDAVDRLATALERISGADYGER